MTQNFDTIIDETAAIVEEYNVQKKALSERMAGQIQSIFDAFFDKYPMVKTIHWTQYTPYFNDGDPCEFGVHEFRYTETPVDKVDEREYTWGEGDDGAIDMYQDDNKLMYEDTVKLEKVLQQSEIFEEIFQQTYGDGVWVKVFRGGYENEEWDHD